MTGLACIGAGAGAGVGTGVGADTGGAFAGVSATGGVLLQAAKKTTLPAKIVQVRKWFKVRLQK